MNEALARSVVDELARRYDRALKRFLGSRAQLDDVADLAHEAYLRVLQASHQGAVRHPRAFLFRTAGNVAIDHARRRRLEAGGPDADAPRAEAGTSDSPDDCLDAALLARTLRAALAELPAPAARAFWLRRFLGASSAEIARELDVSVRMVNKYLAAAIAHVAQRIEAPGVRGQ